MTLPNPKTIKFEIQKAIKTLTTAQIKNEIEVAQNSNDPESIFMWTFGLDELEERLDHLEYHKFINSLT